MCTASFQEPEPAEPVRPPAGAKCAAKCIDEKGRWGATYCYITGGNWGGPCVSCTGTNINMQ